MPIAASNADPSPDSSRHTACAAALYHLEELFGTGPILSRGIPPDPSAAPGGSGTLSPQLDVIRHAALGAGWVVHVLRKPLRDIAWLPRSQVVVVLSAPDGSLRITERRGLFRLVVWSSLTGDTTSRRAGALASELGLPSVAAPVTALLIGPALPADGLRGNPSDLHPVSTGPRGPHGATPHAPHPSPFARLVGLLRPERADITTLFVFSVIAGILYLAVPLAVDAVVNNIAFGGQDKPYFQALLTVSTLLFAFLSLLAVIRTFQHYIAEVLQRRIFLRLTADLSHRLPRVRLDALDRLHAPELVNRFFDTLTVQKSSSLILLEGVNIFLSAMIGLAVLAFYHPFLLGYALVLLLVLTLIVFPGGIGAVQTSIRESVAKYAVAGWLEQLATYPVLFKNPGGSRYALDRSNHLALLYLDARKAHFRILVRQIASLFALQALAGASLLTLGGLLVLRGELTLGQLVASEIIVSTVVAGLAKFGKQLEAWYDALAAVDKLGYLVDLPVENAGGETAAPGASGAHVVGHQLQFAYTQGRPLFDRMDFHAGPGECVGVTGPEGCGASTLLDLLYGTRHPSGGCLFVDNLDLQHWDLTAWRGQATMVRGHELVDGTIAENLRIARPDTSTAELFEALRQVGLLEELLALPQGLETPVLLGGRPLSAAQRTRLVLARALIARPRLLLLDMALDGLDAFWRQQLTGVFFNPDRNWTVIVVSRDPGVLGRCHRVYHLDHIARAPGPARDLPPPRNPEPQSPTP